MRFEINNYKRVLKNITHFYFHYLFQTFATGTSQYNNLSLVDCTDKMSVKVLVFVYIKLSKKKKQTIKKKVLIFSAHTLPKKNIILPRVNKKNIVCLNDRLKQGIIYFFFTPKNWTMTNVSKF